MESSDKVSTNLKYESISSLNTSNTSDTQNPNEDIDIIIQNKISDSIKHLNLFISQNSTYISDNNEDNAIDQYTGKKYNFPQDKLGEFFDLLNKCRKENKILHWGERQNIDNSGLMIDFDRYQKNNNREI